MLAQWFIAAVLVVVVAYFSATLAVAIAVLCAGSEVATAIYVSRGWRND
jgi:hypothetical protein